MNWINFYNRLVYDTARIRSGFKTEMVYFKYFKYFDNAQMFSLIWGLRVFLKTKNSN